MKNPASFRFPGSISMRMTSAGGARNEPAAAPTLASWLAVLAAPACVYLVAASTAAIPREAVAAWFLLGIALVASSGSPARAVAAAVVSVLLYRLLGPDGEFWSRAVSTGDVLISVAFLALAALVAAIASGPRRRIASMTLRQAQGTMRRELAEHLEEHQDEADVARAAVDFIATRLGCPVGLWLGDRTYDSGGAGTLPAVPAAATPGVVCDGWSCFSLDGVEGRLGTLGVRRGSGNHAPDDELLHSLSADVAHAIVRARLTGALHQERLANQSERLCTTLLASVSHDLRTPLTTIMGAAESLRSLGDALPAHERRELLSTIEAESRRLDRYIQNLVDVSRIGDGTFAADLEQSALDDLIATAVARLRRYLPQVRVDVRIDPDVPSVRVHEPLIEQAIFNLLHNASKFSPDGHAISVHATAQPGDAVAVDVLDAGPGIPAAERERVFDMFYSADRGDPARAGTGLGLAISQSIVRAHGGEVSAHTGEEGIGTRMRLLLPRTGTAGCEARP